MYEWNWSNTNHNMYDGSVQITLKLWVLKSCKFYTKEIQSLPLSFLPCNIISSQSFELARWWILDTAHVMRQMELNADSGIKDFFLIVERPNGGRILWQPAPRAGGGDAQGQEGPRGDYRCLKVTPYF